MNRKYKIYTVLILFGILTLMLLQNAYASSESCTLGIIPDKTQVNSGDKITLVLTVSNITSENGIAIYNGLIDYNSDIFELSVQDSSNGEWKGDLIENSVTFTKSDLEATKDNQEIGRIVLKVKNGAAIGKQTITLKNNEFAENTSFSIGDVSTSVEIITSNNNNSNNGNNSNNDTIYDNSNNTNKNNNNFIVDQENKQTTSNNAAANSSEQANKIPHAGTIVTRVISILLIITFMIGIYSFNKYRQMKY